MAPKTDKVPVNPFRIAADYLGDKAKKPKKEKQKKKPKVEKQPKYLDRFEKLPFQEKLTRLYNTGGPLVDLSTPNPDRYKGAGIPVKGFLGGDEAVKYAGTGTSPRINGFNKSIQQLHENMLARRESYALRKNPGSKEGIPEESSNSRVADAGNKKNSTEEKSVKKEKWTKEYLQVTRGARHYQDPNSDRVYAKDSSGIIRSVNKNDPLLGVFLTPL